MSEIPHAYLTQPAKRTTIIVRNLARSRQFYEHHLGLTPFFEGFVGNPGASALIGHSCAGLNMLVLKAAHATLGMIGLMEVVHADPPLPHYQAGESLRAGETIIVIPTTQLDAVIHNLKAAGADFISNPVSMEIPGRGEIHEVFVRDPDGVLLNFSQHGGRG